MRYLFHFFSQKVETIGDAYMTVAGMLDTSLDHAYAITMFAFSMRESARQVLRPTDDTPLAVSHSYLHSKVPYTHTHTHTYAHSHVVQNGSSYILCPDAATGPRFPDSVAMQTVTATAV